MDTVHWTDCQTHRGSIGEASAEQFIEEFKQDKKDYTNEVNTVNLIKYLNVTDLADKSGDDMEVVAEYQFLVLYLPTAAIISCTSL